MKKNKIIKKERIAPLVKRITVSAPDIAINAKAGQFVVVVTKENSERIPLTISSADAEGGIITLIFQEVGFSTQELGALKEGDSIQHVLGPLGCPTDIKKFGTVICVAGGVGIAEILPVAKGLQEAGNRVVGIIGARTKELIILEEDLRKYCHELFIVTDDGSYGKKGLVTDILKEQLVAVEYSAHTIYPALVYAIGPVAMMEAISNLTRPDHIKTIVSLNPIMVDAVGMCGACRVTVGGKTKFGCVDGPEFDGHEVDFKELQKRLQTFKKEERESYKCVTKIPKSG